MVARRALVYQFVARRERRIHVVTTGSSTTAGAISTIADQKTASIPRVTLGPESNQELPILFDVMLAMNPIGAIVDQLPLCISE